MLNYKDNNFFLETIIDAVNNDKLILFIGSGISKLCGLPLWKELALSLLEACAKDKKCKFTYNDYEQFINSISDERELISIAKDILHDAYGNDNTFYKLFTKYLRSENTKKAKKIQNLIFNLAKKIITTNADEVLDNNLTNNSIIYKITDFDKYKTNHKRLVIHIHGSIKSAESLIFTTSDYLKRYADDNFRNAIKELFANSSEYTILFLGYGCREMQLLDFLVNVESTDARKTKTFLLNGYYSNQERVFEAEAKYYEVYGISLIPYLKDEKNYDELLDVLNYINEQKNIKTNILSEELKRFLSLINNEPSDDSVDEFINEYKILDISKKNYIIKKIYESNMANKWVKDLILYDKIQNDGIFTSDLNSFIESSNKNKNVYSFSSLKLLVMVDCYCEDTKDFYINLIKKIVHNIKKIFSDQIIIFDILQLLFSNVEFLLLESVDNFLEKYINESPNPDNWMIAVTQNNILKLLPKEKLGQFFELLLKTFKKTTNISYSFLSFYEAYSSIFCQHMPKQIIDKLISLACDSFYIHQYDYDIYENLITSKSENLDYHNYLKKWIAKSILYLDSKDSIDIFNKFYNSNDIFKKLTAIYTVNVHFDDLCRVFFSSLSFFSDDKIYFSEIYSLIKNNINNIDESLLNPILDFIDHINYSNTNVSVFCKYDLIKMLAHIYSDNPRVDKTLYELNFKIKTNNLMDQYNSIKPEDRSKIIRYYQDFEDKEYSDFKRKIMSIDFQEFIGLLKSYSNDKSNYKVSYLINFIDELIDKFNLFDATSIEKIKGSPINFLEALQGRACDKKISIENKIDLIIKIEECKEVDNSKLSLLSNLYSIVISENHIDNEVKNRVFEHVKSIEITSEMPTSSRSNLQNNDIFSNDAFLKNSILILTCTNENKKYLLNELNNLIKAKNKFCLAAMASTIELLWKLDEKFTRNNLRNIFDYSCNQYNLSYNAFSLSRFCDSEFVECLSKRRILKRLITSNEAKDFAQAYVALIMINFIHAKQSDKVIDIILETDYYMRSLSTLLNYVDRNNRCLLNETYFKRLLELITEKKKSTDMMYMCGLKLLRLLKVDELTKIHEKFILFSFSNKNSSFSCNELLNIINSKKLDTNLNDQLIKQFLTNLDDCFYNLNEIKSLFDKIQGDDIKKIVLNSLDKINPGLLIELTI